VVPVERARLTVVAATWLEARACRRALPGWRVVRVGVGCRKGLPEREGPALVVGLCGALATIEPGTVAIPKEVATPDGRSYTCRPELVERLAAAARRLGLQVAEGRQLSAPAMVTGAERQVWVERGFATVDMEAALVLEQGPGAVVRVVLDTPRDEISAGWERPLATALRPRSWPELIRLARRAPALAARAAGVAAALDLESVAGGDAIAGCEGKGSTRRLVR
jgi:hypothetical protein